MCGRECEVRAGERTATPQYVVVLTRYSDPCGRLPTTVFEKGLEIELTRGVEQAQAWKR